MRAVLLIFLVCSMQVWASSQEDHDLEKLVQQGYPEWIQDSQLIPSILDSVYELPTREEYLPFFESAYHYAIEKEDFINAFDFADAIFEIHDSWGRPQESLKWLKLAKQQIPEEYAREHASLENALAMTYSLKNDLAEEIQHYTQSVQYWKLVDSMRYYRCYPLGNLGMIYYNQEYYDLALQMVRQTMVLSDSLDEPDRLYSKAFDYILLADLMSKLNERDSIAHYTEVALMYAQELDDPTTLVLVKMWALTTYLDMDSLQAAEAFLMDIDWQDITTEARYEIDDSYLMQMARYYVKTGQFKAAASTLKNIPAPLAADDRVRHFEILRDYYLAVGELSSAEVAVDSLWQAYELKMELDQNYNLALRDLEIEKQELQREQKLQSERNSAQTRLILLMVLGFFLLVFAMWKAWLLDKERKVDLLKLSEAHSSLQDKNVEMEQYIQSNIQLEQFAHIAAHDLKTPLRMIASFSSLLKDRLEDRLGEKERDYITYIERGSRDMRDLIDDLLKYSKANAHALEIKSFNLEQVVENVLDSLHGKIDFDEPEIIRKGLNLTMVGDRSKIFHVLENLISNALKFTQGIEPARISISAIRTVAEIQICVSDNGVGIAPEFKDKVFQTFVKLHSQDEFEGTGIGLALCKDTVEKHGGKIWLSSVQGKGSSFYFTIPQAGPVSELLEEKAASFE